MVIPHKKGRLSNVKILAATFTATRPLSSWPRLSRSRIGYAKTVGAGNTTPDTVATNSARSGGRRKKNRTPIKTTLKVRAVLASVYASALVLGGTIEVSDAPPVDATPADTRFVCLASSLAGAGFSEVLSGSPCVLCSAWSLRCLSSSAD